MGKKWRVWIYSWLGLAAGHWALSYYAFVHYRKALTYFISPPEWLFILTLTFPQGLDRHFPPNLTAIARMLPVQSLLLATALTLLLFMLRQIHFRSRAGTMLARAGAVGLIAYCILVGAGVALFIANTMRPMLNLRSADFLTQTARIGWLNRLQPLPGRVLDTQYVLRAYLYAFSGTDMVQFDIAARVPPSEVDRWRKLTWGTFKPVAKDPRTDAAFDALMPWPSGGQWRHTSTPEFYQAGEDAYLIIYRREGIVFLQRME